MAPAPLALTVGDPAGIGPRVSVAAALAHLRGPAGEVPVVLVGDARRLRRAVADAGWEGAVEEVSATGAWALPPGALGVCDAGPVGDAAVAAHGPTAEGGRAQLRALDLGLDAALTGRARALVTGPTSKEAIVRGGTPFSGQTEHLARAAGLAEDAVTMMFLGPRLRLALVTTHVAVARAPALVTEARVRRTVVHLAEALLRLRVGAAPAGSGGAHGGAGSADSEGMRRDAPALVVAALNPHAGEGGLFGDEDQRVVAPGVASALALPPLADGRVRCEGVRPAEAALRDAASGKVDGVVCMLHDQATIPAKLLDWGRSVNVTWGLPFVRTSVDHGVAYDAAARGEGDPEGMHAAVRMALRLAPAADPDASTSGGADR
jgi:4-hydroxythreonine-4-phosphate dehydrogenase